MYRLRICVFSTLVLMQSPIYAAPVDISPTQETQVTEQSNAPEENAIDLTEMSISPPPPVPKQTKSKESVYVYYKNSMSPRFGAVMGNTEEENNNDDDVLSIGYLLGLNYYFDTVTRGKFETGLDLYSGGIGVYNFSRKWVYTPTARLSPHFKAGVDVILRPKSGFATVLDFDNYLLAGAMGIEDFLYDPMSLRFDLEVAVGIKDYSIKLVFGYSWGW